MYFSLSSPHQVCDWCDYVAVLCRLALSLHNFPSLYSLSSYPSGTSLHLYQAEKNVKRDITYHIEFM